jgi:two-component system LytT family response regulator
VSAEHSLRVLIVDDEPLARRGLRLRLEQMSMITVIGECASGREAVEVIEREKPDLVLLDIQMPELTGFEVIEAIGVDEMPVTVFVTAYDQHAIRAFEANALDYLLKPVDDDRFSRAVERARMRVAERSAMGRALSQTLQDTQRQETRLVVRDRGRVVLLEYSEIDWIDAEGDYLRLHASGRSYLIRHTMAAMEERLAASTFARIHRSTLVNIDRVREVRASGDRDYQVILRDGSKLRMSRRYRGRLHIDAGGGT